MEKDETLSTERAVITDTMFEQIQDMVEACDLEGLEESSSGGSYSTDDFVSILVNYQSGRQIYREYYGEDIPEEWYGKRDLMMQMLDRYLEENPA